jgi:hypothetical protein
MKKMWNRESSKGTMVGDIAVTPVKKQTKVVAAKTASQKDEGI